LPGDRASRPAVAKAGRLGLGLKIVHRVAEIDGGSFAQTGAADQGTTARIVFLSVVDKHRGDFMDLVRRQRQTEKKQELFQKNSIENSITTN
jgi:hypothetical protein